MEKETVDYVIVKLNEVFQGIKPDAMELGQEYISYMVMKQNMQVLIAIGVALIGLIGILVLYKKKESLDVETNFFHATIVMFSIVFLIMGSIGAISKGYSAIIANQYPLMWTIEQLAK